jgi:hypothetical protein
MDAAAVKRKLRELKRLEQLLTGGNETFDAFFALEEGKKARYPFRMLCVFDKSSRDLAFKEFLDQLWGVHDSESAGEAVVVDRGAFGELIRALGLPAETSREEVIRLFRTQIKELHPDVGGEHELAVELISLYKRAFSSRRD